jgi:hypothetical protein
MDIATWLARHGEYVVDGPGYHWAYDAAIPAHDPRTFATALVDFAEGDGGKSAALALDAIRDAVARGAGGGAWLEAFTDVVLARPAFVRAAALAYNPPVPLGEQYALDRRSDAYLARDRQPRAGKVAELARELMRDPARGPADAERLWWSLTGGSLGIASQLAHAADAVAPAPARELRRHLVEGAHAALTRGAFAGGMPFWSRAWIVEHLAHIDRPLLEDLLWQEQEPWLALQMRFELGR